MKKKTKLERVLFGENLAQQKASKSIEAIYDSAFVYDAARLAAIAIDSCVPSYQFLCV